MFLTLNLQKETNKISLCKKEMNKKSIISLMTIDVTVVVENQLWTSATIANNVKTSMSAKLAILCANYITNTVFKKLTVRWFVNELFKN